MREEYRTGRLIDHLHLRAADLQATKRFYRAVLDAVGVPYREKPDRLVADELYIDAGETPSRVHLAFQASDEETVRRFHAAAIAAGGRDNGGPGVRTRYSQSYYAA